MQEPAAWKSGAPYARPTQQDDCTHSDSHGSGWRHAADVSLFLRNGPRSSEYGRPGRPDLRTTPVSQRDGPQRRWRDCGPDVLAGTTYTPGQQQTLTLTDHRLPRARLRFPGERPRRQQCFQRPGGQFYATASQIVICENGSLRGSSGCPASAPVQFIEHSRPFSTNTDHFHMDRPGVRCRPGDDLCRGECSQWQWRRHRRSHLQHAIAIEPSATAGADAPKSRPNGVVSASAFKSSSATAPGSWLEIFGDEPVA